MARPRKQPIPLTIVAGPPGAGKTTLINRALKHDAFANTAVILNEFGEVELENALVETADDGVIALGTGCVCCMVRGELVDALERLLRDLDNGRIAAIGRVIVEADAAADPSAILAAVGMHPYLSLRYRPDGIVTVISTWNERLPPLRPITQRQLAMADVVAFSQSSVAPGTLAALNPLARIVEAATVDPPLLAGYGPFDPETTDVAAWLGTAGAASESPPVNTFAIERDRAMPLAALDRFLEFIVALQGVNLIRVRGLVATGEGDSVAVEGVGAYFRPPLLFAPAHEGPAVRFAVSATHLDRAGFAGYLDAFLNEARIDTPDRAALTDNPLSVAGFSARSGR